MPPDGQKTKLNFCSAIYSILCTCWCWWKHCQLFSCTVYLFGWFYAFICLLLEALFCIEVFFVNLFVAQFFVAVLMLYENVFFVYQVWFLVVLIVCVIFFCDSFLYFCLWSNYLLTLFCICEWLFWIGVFVWTCWWLYSVAGCKWNIHYAKPLEP